MNKLNQKDEANKAFATSVQIDLNLPKAWAEWGMFNDRRFKENPNDMVYANNAISCYLQAAGLYKNGKTRKLLARILWLISLDDASGHWHKHLKISEEKFLYGIDHFYTTIVDILVTEGSQIGETDFDSNC